MTNLLVELQTEELPPKALEKLSAAFANGVEQHLKSRGFLAEGSVMTAYGAPRRLAVHITDVLAKSPDEAFTQKLVPVRVLPPTAPPRRLSRRRWLRSASNATLPL